MGKPKTQKHVIRPRHGEKWRMRDGRVVQILHYSTVRVYGRFYKVINDKNVLEQFPEAVFMERVTG